jgi:hypothetical protein
MEQQGGGQPLLCFHVLQGEGQKGPANVSNGKARGVCESGWFQSLGVDCSPAAPNEGFAAQSTLTGPWLREHPGTKPEAVR